MDSLPTTSDKSKAATVKINQPIICPDNQLINYLSLENVRKLKIERLCPANSTKPKGIQFTIT